MKRPFSWSSKYRLQRFSNSIRNGVSALKKRWMVALVLGFALSPTLFLFQNCAPGFELTQQASLGSKALSLPDINLVDPLPEWVKSGTLTLKLAPRLDARASVASLTCQLDNANPVNCSSLTYRPNVGDGSHRISIKLTDSFGQQTENVFLFSVDQTGPIIVPIYAPILVSALQTDEVRFTGTDNLVAADQLRFECAFDTPTYTPCTSPFPLTNLSVGPHEVRIRAFDKAGNPSNIYDYTWTVNLTAPTATITGGPANNGATNLKNVLFAFQGPPGALNYSYVCSTDNAAPQPCASPTTVSNLSEGSHSFAVFAVSGAGIRGTPDTRNFMVDSTAPAAPTITANKTSPTKETNIVFTFSASDGSGSGIDKYKCQLDSTAYADCASGAPYTASTGNHTIKVKAIDKAGNESLEATFPWLVDNIQPGSPSLSSTTTQLNVYANSANAIFNFTAIDNTGGSGVSSFICTLNSRPLGQCTTGINVTADEGNNVFSVIAVDGAGNQSAATQWTWALDKTPPTVPTLNSNVTSPTKLSAIRFDFSATDGNGSGIASYECQLDTASVQACGSPLDLSNIPDGHHIFKVRAKDRVGNLSASWAEFQWDINSKVTIAVADLERSTWQIPCAVTGNDASVMANFQNGNQYIEQWTYHATGCGAAEGIEYLEFTTSNFTFTPDQTGSSFKWDRTLQAYIIKPLAQVYADYLNGIQFCGHTDYFVGNAQSLPVSCALNPRSTQVYWASRVEPAPSSTTELRLLNPDLTSGDATTSAKRPINFLRTDSMQKRAPIAANLIAIPRPTTAVQPGSEIILTTTGRTLSAGSGIITEGVSLMFNTDGKLYVKNSSGTVLWSSPNATRNCNSGCVFVWETSGIFYLSQNNSPYWTSGSISPQAKLWVRQTAPYISVIDIPSQLEIFSGTDQSSDTLSFGLGKLLMYPGSERRLRDGTRLAYQTDGNLVVYGSGGGVLFSGNQQTGCAYNVPSCSTLFQTDGNLVSYDSFRTHAYFATDTTGLGAVRMEINSIDGVAMYNNDGTKVYPIPYEPPGGY